MTAADLDMADRHGVAAAPSSTRGAQIELRWVTELIEARDRLDDVEVRYTRHVLHCEHDPDWCEPCLDLARELSAAHDGLTRALDAIPPKV